MNGTANFSGNGVNALLRKKWNRFYLRQ